MNTASRMESTGLAGRIQASNSTVELLRMAGKHSWITPRADLVPVKGKGTWQTYWVVPTLTAAQASNVAYPLAPTKSTEFHELPKS